MLSGGVVGTEKSKLVNMTGIFGSLIRLCGQQWRGNLCQLHLLKMNYIDLNGIVVTTPRYWVIPGGKVSVEWCYPYTHI